MTKENLKTEFETGKKITQQKMHDLIDFIPEGGGEPLETPTNLTKLALTDIQPGQEVLITEEANRLEKYIGGDIDDDANWIVLRNTFELLVTVTELNGVKINGIVTTQDIQINIGWTDGHLLFEETGTLRMIECREVWVYDDQGDDYLVSPGGNLFDSTKAPEDATLKIPFPQIADRGLVECEFRFSFGE